MTPTSKPRWDVERYEASHSYVWKFGEDLLSVLAAQPGERIIDLGCGSGQLSAKIAESGAHVIGIDYSTDMVAQARINYPSSKHPHLEFRLADATSFAVDPPADALFSNAALHWVKDQPAAIAAISRAIKPGGRFVAELGGRGNIGAIMESLGAILGGAEEKSPWHFPSISEYAALLEANGFLLRSAVLFDRPTPVEGTAGLDDWLQMFGGVFFQGMPEPEKDSRRRAVADHVRPRLYRDDKWILDYRRLRVVAERVAS
ncbi:MAG: methyltransferase domain-containing protein [Bryobacteraceae bacterium]